MYLFAGQTINQLNTNHLANKLICTAPLEKETPDPRPQPTASRTRAQIGIGLDECDEERRDFRFGAPVSRRPLPYQVFNVPLWSRSWIPLTKANAKDIIGRI